VGGGSWLYRGHAGLSRAGRGVRGREGPSNMGRMRGGHVQSHAQGGGYAGHAWLDQSVGRCPGDRPIGPSP
jgi:hypothetical protein